VSLNRTAPGYTLTACGGAVGGVRSPPVTGVQTCALRLSFTQQPTNTVAGGAISPAVQLSALDPAGNLVPTFTGSVTVALGNNPRSEERRVGKEGAAGNGAATLRERRRNKTRTGDWLRAKE